MDEATDAPTESAIATESASPEEAVSPQESLSEAPAVSTASTPPEPPDLARPSNLGIWSFVLAILGLVLLPIVGSVVGFILGRVAIRQADTRRLRGGRGLAIAAVTISVITLVVIALSIAAYALAIAYLEV
jgi:hypothetical protein